MALEAVVEVIGRLTDESRLVQAQGARAQLEDDQDADAPDAILPGVFDVEELAHRADEEPLAAGQRLIEKQHA
ncbi:MAG: hypothetical protein JXO72_07985 [Vicinamibacteria bacterium]|nr:hypothetical protein [Vicinamibacteria bacterium]